MSQTFEPEAVRQVPVDKAHLELLKKAMGAYEKGRDLGADKIPGRVGQLNIGRLLEVEGQYDKAKEIYETLAKLPSMESEIPEIDEEELAKKSQREQRADMIRASLRASTGPCRWRRRRG